MSHITYIYSAHSAYAYLGAQALYDICRDKDVTLHHQPILLSPVVEAAGSVSFATRTQPHVDYFFGREIERWAEWRNVPMIRHRPTYHDNPLDLPNGLIIAAQESGLNVDALSLAILRAHWRDDADIADPQTLRALADGLGLDADALLSAALSEPVQAIHRANTADAIARSVFGSPTYIVDGDPFYGQDRLEMVAHALSHPFGKTDAAVWHEPLTR